MRNILRKVNEQNILRISAMIFDLLGLVKPVIQKLRITFKELYEIKELYINKYNWDGVTDDEYCLFTNLTNLISSKLLSSSETFCVVTKAMSIFKGSVMHQENLYNVVVYVKVVFNNDVQVDNWQLNEG